MLPDDELDKLIMKSIINVQTHAHKAKDLAGDLRANGFEGRILAELRTEAEKVIKYVHEYQAYINCAD